MLASGGSSSTMCHLEAPGLADDQRPSFRVELPRATADYTLKRNSTTSPSTIT
jgi:hypothetical protein